MHTKELNASLPDTCAAPLAALIDSIEDWIRTRSGLDPDPNRYSAKMLDPDPDL